MNEFGKEFRRKNPEDVPSPLKKTIVGLDKWFPLIGKNRGSIQEETVVGYKFIDTDVAIDVGFERPLPFSMLLAQDHLGWDMREVVEYEEGEYPSFDRNSVIIPFNIDHGYHIDDEDFDAETRQAKKERLQGVVPTQINGEEQFAVDGISLWLRDPKDTSTTETEYDLPETFEDLNVALSFPTVRLQTSYDHAPWQNPNAVHQVIFDTRGFYTPEAPNLKFGLVLPADKEKLRQVHAKFFLTEKRANNDELVEEDTEEN
jgi:hypothetical protein